MAHCVVNTVRAGLIRPTCGLYGFSRQMYEPASSHVGAGGKDRRAPFRSVPAPVACLLSAAPAGHTSGMAPHVHTAHCVVMTVHAWLIRIVCG
jgi:hypothetical protein